MTIPIGYTQSNAQQPLQPNPRPLSLSIIGEPIPAAHYARVQTMTRTIYPDKYGPLKKQEGGA